MGLNLGGKCGMFFLITINGIFLALGIALLVVGILLKVDAKVINDSKVISTLNEVSFNGLKFGNLANSLPIILIVLGVVILVISGLGIFGACCKNRCMLVMFAIIVLLIFVVQIAAVILYGILKNKIESEAKSLLKKGMNNYDGVSSTSEVSNGWDLIFIGFDCCGVDAVNAVSNQEFKDTKWWAKRVADYIPYSCCTAATQDNYKTTTDAACTASFTGAQTKGCYDAIKDYILKYQTAAIAIGISLLVIELIGIVFAFVLCRAISKSGEIV
ncbi:tetraspanin-9-like [Dreissena polymorpha]|uniref:Tetraspanin n=1 Tax=Dreissena polymorpha TaxID=45954 RepID=A0A9D4H5K7_DREPO|nr:tetraspanin-9-like [Dreissena polymorpha]KAH3825737.1 hypothetical protein DPMN_127618 [Dreissena polymorpha]